MLQQFAEWDADTGGAGLSVTQSEAQGDVCIDIFTVDEWTRCHLCSHPSSGVPEDWLVSHQVVVPYGGQMNSRSAVVKDCRDVERARNILPRCAIGVGGHVEEIHVLMEILTGLAAWFLVFLRLNRDERACELGCINASKQDAARRGVFVVQEQAEGVGANVAGRHHSIVGCRY